MFFKQESVKVVACRMLEAIIFDESITDKYRYVYFPGMCPCIGIIVKDKTELGRMATIHYLGGTNPESVLAFIKNYFPDKKIEIITFAANTPNDFDIPPNFPTISVTSPDIKNDILPKLESTGFLSDEYYYNIALQNRYEFNYILKALKENGWDIEHIHNNSVEYGDNVFFDLKTQMLASNLPLTVIRDDDTEEQGKNIFFNKDSVIRHNLSFSLYQLWNGWNNIIITDKRSWAQYGSDLAYSVINKF